MQEAERSTSARPGWSQRLRKWLESPYVLTVILAIGLLVRARHFFAGLSYWYDEAFLLIPVFERSAADLLGPLPTHAVIPPLFLWLLRGVYLVGGAGELVMRLPAFVAGIVGLVLMIPMAMRLIGRPGAYWAVALCALSHHAVMHGSEVRSYTCDFLASVLILLAACEYVNGRTPLSRRLGGIALLFLGLAAPWISFTSVFVLGAASLALLSEAVAQGGRRRWLLWSLLSGLVLASAFLVWYVQAR